MFLTNTIVMKKKRFDAITIAKCPIIPLPHPQMHQMLTMHEAKAAYSPTKYWGHFVKADE